MPFQQTPLFEFRGCDTLQHIWRRHFRPRTRTVKLSFSNITPAVLLAVGSFEAAYNMSVKHTLFSTVEIDFVWIAEL